MSEFEAIASGIQNHAQRIRSVSENGSPDARAQMLTLVSEYERHAEELRMKIRASSTRSG